MLLENGATDISPVADTDLSTTDPGTRFPMLQYVH